VRNKAETAIDLSDPDGIEDFFLYHDRFLPFLSVMTYISLFEKIIFVIFSQNDCRFNQVPLNCHHFP